MNSFTKNPNVKKRLNYVFFFFFFFVGNGGGGGGRGEEGGRLELVNFLNEKSK